MTHEFSKKSVAVIAAVSLVSGFLGGAVSGQIFDGPSYQNGDAVQPVKVELVEEKSEVIDAIEKVSPSVVSIVITQELKNIRSQGMSPFDLFFKDDPFFQDFFGDQFRMQPQPEPAPEDDEPVKQKVGGGSGFIVTENGMVLTNRHVVARDDAEYTVITHDGTEYDAKVVSRDPFNDIAVIQIMAKSGSTRPRFTPVKLGNSNDLKIGQSVIAIGNALAEFANSATRGIISAKGRQILASDGSGSSENLSGLIQTDAAINPGNSGGPLINLAGEVVGVNTAIASGANGIGFAIPIDDVKPVIKSIEEHGKIVRPILGVMFTMLTPELAKELDLKVEEGAVLKGDGKSFAVLPGKPAEKAGLQEKDVILEVNGVKVNEENPLQREIMKYMPGDKVKIKYLRNGKELETTVTLEEAETDVKKE